MATTPTAQEQVTSNIPSWAQPYASRLLGQAEALTDLSKTGYQPYMVPRTDAQGNIIIDPATGQPEMVAGQRVAGFSPLQMQAFQNIAGMQTADQIRQASGLAGLAGIRAGELSQYDPARQQQFYRGPQFREMGTGFERIGAPGTTQYQMGAPERVAALPIERYMMGPAERVGAERFGIGAMQDYMSPYMQGVVEQQKRAAVQDYMRQIPGIGAAAVQAGAKGGTREALIRSEAQRGLQERLGDIEATGLQQAYQQAASQFGQDRAAMMQAALANQGAGLTTGQQNLQAALAQQSLQAQQALEAQRLNQAAGLTTGQTNLQALINQAQFGAGQNLSAQQANQAAQLQAQQQALGQLASANQFGLQNAAQRAQYGLSGAQLAESSRQFGAGLGLQGLQQQLAAAGALGGLGMQQYQQQMGIGQAQLGAGGQMQALEQELLNQQYQDFINKQQFPYKQLEFMSGILRGTPATGQTSTLYQQPGSLFGQIAGVGLGLGSLFGGLGGSNVMTGTATGTPSDRRLKSNVVRIGTHPLGIGVYEYDIWGLRQRGVMADEVLTVMPEAVSLHENGYLAVRYDMIGGV